ncbi:tRNA (N(6)-L-threonylcarbamoyladenosine(37)-C(2))-methylthiotransferase MtaB [Oscillospiraceae bacterium WX1]
MRFCFETLGCKVNQFETQALETILTARGHTVVRPGEGCQAVIINTCAVTAESGRKSRQAVRRLKKLEPGAVVAVCGCFSQLSPAETASLGADLVGGSGDRLGFADALERVVADKTTQSLVDDARARRVFEELPAGRVAGRTRALLKIEDGCDNFCTYCIIPYARGPVRSMPPARIADEAARLVADGCREIVLTGIEISSYGKDLAETATLLDAVEAAYSAAPDARIRLGSLEPRTITPQFCAFIKALPNICDHFHLSLQSGSDATLRRMKRRYTTEDFFKAVTLLRDTFPKCGITADLIVGFPGESDAEFEETLTFIRKCAFTGMHIFPFSIRLGTPAATMPQQVEKTVKEERARRVTDAAREMEQAFAGQFIGSVLDVLFERETDMGTVGHAGNYLEVSVPDTGIRNRLLPVRLEALSDGILTGKIGAP